MDTFNVIGLDPGTTHFFNVSVRDQAGNKAAYTMVTVTTAADTKAPVPGGSGEIAVSNLGATSLTLAWIQASDNASNGSQLQYEVRRALTNNIGTVADA